MSLGWDTLPLLPLRCILEHLSTEDALAAMSTCCHWRNAIMFYEGYKDTLKLRTKRLDKTMFLSRIFKRHVRKLHIYLDCNERDVDKFINFVLPQFFDAMKLNEVLFIGPSYLKQSVDLPVVKLKRIIIESFIFKHQHSIQKVALMGCEMDTVKNENERYTNKQVEYYSRPLNFSSVPSPGDSVLSRCNTHIMRYSTLQHIMVEYDQINTQTMETLSHLPMFGHLSINIMDKKHFNPEPIDWRSLNECYGNKLEVSVNIISLPENKISSVMDNILVEGLMLTSLKVIFCKSVFAGLISHVSRLYQGSIREVVWADAPYRSTHSLYRYVPPTLSDTHIPNTNPFVLLCWNCVNLRRLVIHGYWVWHYDLLGFIRLRKSLSQLEVSALYYKQASFDAHSQSELAVRVLLGDRPIATDHQFVERVNKCMDFEWKPIPWNSLHPALRSHATPGQRADYIVKETMDPLGIT